MDYNKAFLYFTFQRKEPLSGCEIVQSGIHHKGNGLRLKQPDRKKKYRRKFTSDCRDSIDD